MCSLAVIGSGPSALYTVKYVLKRIPSLKIHIYEKLPELFGLVRFGVAPDHPEVKNVAHEFTEMLNTHPNIHVHLNTEIRGISALMTNGHSAVLIGTGAQKSKKIPTAFQPHQSARDFVLWYNGHPEGERPALSGSQAGNVSVVGMGNVALDVARLLSKSPAALTPLRDHGLSAEAIEWMTDRQKNFNQQKCVRIFARRGYPEASFTNKEFRELLHVQGALAVVDPADLCCPFDEIVKQVERDRAKKRGLEILEEMMKNHEVNMKQYENIIQLKFNKNIERVLDDPCDLLISSVGFQVEPVPGLQLNSETGAYRQTKGRVVGHQGVYVVGWAKRGPKGNIASNIPDAVETAASIVEDLQK